MIISPVQFYEVNNQTTPILTTPASIAAGTTTTLITGVSGKRLRIHGWSAQTEVGAAVPASFSLTDGSGGAALCRTTYAPISTATPAYEKPFIHAGYFETTTGTGLGIVTATSNLKIDVHYSVYTPN